MYIEKYNKFNHEISSTFESEIALPTIETVQLTTFADIRDYVVGDIFSNPTFEARIPTASQDVWLYTCRFLNQDRAEEYFTNCSQTENLENFDIWSSKLHQEKVEVLNIEFQSQS